VSDSNLLSQETSWGDAMTMLDHVHIRLLTYNSVRLDPPYWRFPAIQSSFWRFYSNDRDGAWIEHNGQRSSLEQGRLYFIPAGVRFSTDLHQSVGHLYIHFDLLGLPYQVQQESFATPVCLPSQPIQEHTTRLLRVELEQQTSDLLLQFRIKAILYEALLLCLQSLSAEQIQRCLSLSEAAEPIVPALQYIEANLGAQLSNGELASRCHMNTDYFIRRFRQSMGRTPGHYIQEQRVKGAEQQLLMTHQSIEQIAANNGFGSRFYFTRVFTRHTGVSPAAYRKGLCGM
jgi:AraC-like DNA-binding protein